MRAGLTAAVAFLVLFGFSLFLSGSVDGVELAAGICFALFGCFLWHAIVTVARKHYAPPQGAATLGRWLLALPVETVRVGLLLAKVAIKGQSGHLGDFLRQPFDPGRDEPSSAGRRALAILGISLAPRTFVIRGERQEELMLHALPPKQAVPNTAWPI